MRWVVPLGLFLLSALGSVWLTRFYLLRLPPDYFVAESPPSRTRSQWVLRNLGALVLVIVGILLSLPGVPGQGLLTMVVGLLLADLPGKQRLERRWLGHPKVLGPINDMRARANVPPLDRPPSDEGGA